MLLMLKVATFTKTPSVPVLSGCPKSNNRARSSGSNHFTGGWPTFKFFVKVGIDAAENHGGAYKSRMYLERPLPSAKVCILCRHLQKSTNFRRPRSPPLQKRKGGVSFRITTFRISRQARARQHGNVVSRENGHAVPGALPLPDCFVPDSPQGIHGKAPCSALSSWRLTTSGSVFANQSSRLSSRLLMLLMLKVATLTKPLSVRAVLRLNFSGSRVCLTIVVEWRSLYIRF